MRGVVESPQKTVPGNTTQLISIPQGQECQAQTQGGAEQLLNILLFQYSVQFSRSVVSDSLQLHESQHARPPSPSPTLESTQTHVHPVSDAIQPSHLLSSPSPPALNLSQHQGLFKFSSVSNIGYTHFKVTGL